MNPDFSIPRGDGYSLIGQYTISGESATASGIVLTMSVKGDLAIFSQPVIGPITAYYTNQALGEFVFPFDESDTTIRPGIYDYDIKVVGPDGVPHHTPVRQMEITGVVT